MKDLTPISCWLCTMKDLTPIFDPDFVTPILTPIFHDPDFSMRGGPYVTPISDFYMTPIFELTL